MSLGLTPGIKQGPDQSKIVSHQNFNEIMEQIFPLLKTHRKLKGLGLQSPWMTFSGTPGKVSREAKSRREVFEQSQTGSISAPVTFQHPGVPYGILSAIHEQALWAPIPFLVLLTPSFHFPLFSWLPPPLPLSAMNVFVKVPAPGKYFFYHFIYLT